MSCKANAFLRILWYSKRFSMPVKNIYIDLFDYTLTFYYQPMVLLNYTRYTKIPKLCPQDNKQLTRG